MKYYVLCFFCLIDQPTTSGVTYDVCAFYGWKGLQVPSVVALITAVTITRRWCVGTARNRRHDKLKDAYHFTCSFWSNLVQLCNSYHWKLLFFRASVLTNKHIMSLINWFLLPIYQTGWWYIWAKLLLELLNPTLTSNRIGMQTLNKQSDVRLQIHTGIRAPYMMTDLNF